MMNIYLLEHKESSFPFSFFVSMFCSVFVIFYDLLENIHTCMSITNLLHVPYAFVFNL